MKLSVSFATGIIKGCAILSLINLKEINKSLPESVSVSTYPKSPSPSVYSNSKIIIESLGRAGWGNTSALLSAKVGIGESENEDISHPTIGNKPKIHSIFAQNMNPPFSIPGILSANIKNPAEFEQYALALFNYQYQNIAVYKQYCDQVLPYSYKQVDSILKIPFIPVSLFKTHKILAPHISTYQTFSSSSTGGSGPSYHHMPNLQDYLSLCTHCFENFLGDPGRYCHIALLPSYLERSGSSLVSMVWHFIEHGLAGGGFYLHNTSALIEQLNKLQSSGTPTVLWGVSFALWDLCEQSGPHQFSQLRVIETGGMKGRRREITRQELHTLIRKGLGCHAIHSEYGMTEMSSQCYSLEQGLFSCPQHVKVLFREADDPLSNALTGKNGCLNVIDLGNIYSCAFLGLSDLGNVYSDGSFEVLGRLDYSDIRGCNLMVQ